MPQLLDPPAETRPARREPIPLREALLMQVAAIVGAEPATSFVEVRCLHPDGRPGPRAFVPVREHRRVLALVRRLSDRHEVLLGATPRVRRAGTADAVERVWCLRADCDTEAAVERLRAFRPAPSIVVASSLGRAHAYWSLTAPLPPSWARQANRRLAYALGSDQAVSDTPRVMRAIGSSNHKYTPPALVLCTRCELDAFACEQVVGGLPDPPERRRPPRRPSAPITADAARVLGGLTRTVRKAKPGNRNHALHWAACRVRDRADEGLLDVDDGRDALREAALDAGLGEHEVEATIASGLGGGA